MGHLKVAATRGALIRFAQPALKAQGYQPAGRYNCEAKWRSRLPFGMGLSGDGSGGPARRRRYLKVAATWRKPCES